MVPRKIISYGAGEMEATCYDFAGQSSKRQDIFCMSYGTCWYRLYSWIVERRKYFLSDGELVMATFRPDKKELRQSLIFIEAPV